MADNLEPSYQRAMAAAGSAPRPKKVYVRTKFILYEMSPKAIKKWAEQGYFGADETLKRIGKPLFEMNAAQWQPYPWAWDKGNLSIKSESKEGKIIRWESIPIHGLSGHDIKHAVAKAQMPKKNDMRHYKALLAASRRTGWPKQFKADLTEHDKINLAHRDPDLPFGWILREGGTHLIAPEEMKDDWVKIMKGSYNDIDKKCTFFGWDGTTLLTMTPDHWNSWMGKKKRFMQGESKDID